MIPAALVVVSKFQALSLSVTVKVVSVAERDPDAVTLEPAHVLTAAPYTSFFVTSFITCLVVVVLFIDPDVN